MRVDAASLFQQHCARPHADDSLHLPGWSVDDWRHLLARAQPVAVPAGEVVIRRGDRERALYFVVAGALEVRASGRDALGPLFREAAGSVIGEIALFDGLPRTATVWAVEDAELLRLDDAALHAFAAEHPARANQLLFALGRVLAFHLRRSAGGTGNSVSAG